MIKRKCRRCKKSFTRWLHISVYYPKICKECWDINHHSMRCTELVKVIHGDRRFISKRVHNNNGINNLGGGK